MTTMLRALMLLTVAATAIPGAFAQQPSNQQSQDDKQAQAEKAFKQGNSMMEQRKPDEALVHYKQAVALWPDDPSILFNTGLAAFLTKDLTLAADVWKQLKTLEPDDWQTRAKLVQVYQALGKQAERDKERTELFELWKSAQSKPSEPTNSGDQPLGSLKEQFQYCREQFEIKGQKVMVFEHFELKGDRALRYVFSILNKAENGEEFRISLGSYEVTNAIWRATKDPKPKDNERLFHLDGYFRNMHVTYGMYFPEPSYDDVRARVIQILETRPLPISPPEAKPTPNQSHGKRAMKNEI